MSDVSPLVATVASELASRIRSGALPSGRTLPSERQLAEEFGVSRIVIRAAVKEVQGMGLLLCKPRCRPIVQPSAPLERMPETAAGPRTIAIWLWPNTADYAAASILKGIQRAVRPDQARLVVASAAGDHWWAFVDSEERFLRSLAEDPHAMGAIVWYLGGERNRPALDAVRSAGVPLVFVDRLPPDDFDADFVGTNNDSAAYACVRHLVELGHRRIALITNSDKVSAVREREAGYRRALAEAGIAYRDDLLWEDRLDLPEGVEAALDSLLGLPHPPTAIFGINDHIALQVHEALVSRGIDVPGRISVVGFDGLLRWVPGGGYLTGAQQDFSTMGQLAAELILRRAQEGAPRAYRHLLLDAPLVLKGSTDRREPVGSEPLADS